MSATRIFALQSGDGAPVGGPVGWGRGIKTTPYLDHASSWGSATIRRSGSRSRSCPCGCAPCCTRTDGSWTTAWLLSHCWRTGWRPYWNDRVGPSRAERAM